MAELRGVYFGEESKTRLVIDAAINNNDDADFVEQCVLGAFETSDPVYVVGGAITLRAKKFLTSAVSYSSWLSADDARWRVKWCLQIFQAKVFLMAHSQLKSEY